MTWGARRIWSQPLLPLRASWLGVSAADVGGTARCRPELLLWTQVAHNCQTRFAPPRHRGTRRRVSGEVLLLVWCARALHWLQKPAGGVRLEEATSVAAEVGGREPSSGGRPPRANWRREHSDRTCERDAMSPRRADRWWKALRAADDAALHGKAPETALVRRIDPIVSTGSLSGEGASESRCSSGSRTASCRRGWARIGRSGSSDVNHEALRAGLPDGIQARSGCSSLKFGLQKSARRISG